MTQIERPTSNSARATVTYPIAPELLLAAFQNAIETLPRWTVGPSEKSELKAVRKTRLFRFRDDVKIQISADETGSRADLTSASRIGKGDLGQNPRNLKELLRAVEREAPHPRS
ncbi:DUF1499 domain-containing protein [Rubrobacter tropicus]|uniref:DUF1499 domain-containing protein n=1 Tax=Rubrobacter tropicus TaxID=2653851 RepID=A0A6G8Q836_9ACTN|nr:DUF1499 domain-containing protein [Rubrobacter tropicus]QIN82609.1 DUF1499 domain-containing protein [Rubrobacter tropicus]